ncbi:MAG: hypothetical protein FWD73_02625 [Polyangiaceae bacterium]|nr:hypothetical protein [Polyangiaceae bacterium]
MKAIQRMATVTVGTTLALGLVACSQKNDLSKNLASAESRLTSAQVDARKNVNSVDAQYGEDRSAAVTRGQHDVADAQRDVSDAKSAIAQDRQSVANSARTRIDILDSTANQYKKKAQSFQGDKKVAFDTEWTKYQSSRGEAQSKLNALNSAPNDSWTTAREGLKSSLSSLGTAVDNLGKFF